MNSGVGLKNEGHLTASIVSKYLGHAVSYKTYSSDYYSVTHGNEFLINKYNEI